MKIVFFLLFITVSPIICATNYFISYSAGDDTKDGKSEANAWKTISKVNSSSFSPGDIISFKRGDVWREMMSVPSSGNAGAYLVFTAYGTGPNPRILGSKQATTWTNQGGNVWKSATSVSNPSTYSNLFFVESSSKNVVWGVRKSNTSGLISEFDWTWSSNNIYVYAATDPGSRYFSVEAPQRLFSIDLNDKNYIEINGIDMFFSTWGGVLQHTDNASFTGFTMRNCEVAYHGDKNGYGYGVYLCYNKTLIEDCVFHDLGRRGVSINNYSNYDISDVMIQRCTFYNGYHTTGPDIESGTSTSGDLSNVTVRYCLIYDDPDRDLGWGVNSVFVQGPHGGSGEVHDFYFYCNIVKFPHGNSISLERVYGSYIYNNTFYGHNPNWTPSYSFYADTYCTGVVVKNNIFYTLLSNENQGNGAGLVTYGMSDSQVNANYNLYYRINNNVRIVNATGTAFYMNQIANLRTSKGWEINSPTPGNPLFTSASDYHLLEGSPAIGAGVAIPEVTVDFEGKPFNNPPNIGCYATQIVTGNPVYLSSTIENATPSTLEMVYNMTLSNIVPAASAFTVSVNNVTRTIGSVSISGNKVLLTLSSPVVYGDAVTVAYTKPATNPIQASTGDQAVTITAQPVINKVSAVNPVYVTSSVENATPSIIEMTYNMILANIVPPASAFTVRVNSVTRTVSSVSISGTKVRLTLASPAVYGDIVTVAYTKPASNPLQTSAGGQAASVTAQTVVNNVLAGNPVYISSSVENATPSTLEITYNLTLANIVPPPSAFTVRVNSVIRPVTSVSISGNKVRLVLSSRVFYADVVSVAYIKPASNPLQTPAGTQVESVGALATVNNCINVNPVVAINSPANNSIFPAPAVVVLTASASDIDGTISKVEFFNGGIKLGETFSNPYTFTWNNVPAGTYSLTAVATDNFNASTTSPAISFSVSNSVPPVNQPPVISIFNPTKGEKYTIPVNLTIDAVASDPDGSISKVEFFNGSSKIGELTSPPYSFTWKDLAVGTYIITAAATDNDNAVTVSLPVDVIVENELGVEVDPNPFSDPNAKLIDLYPNPNDGHFTLDLTNPLKDEKIDITVATLAGKAVYKGIMVKDETQKQIDLPNIKSGFYVLMISRNEIIIVKKFIKR